MFVHKVLFEFLAFKHPRLLLVSPSDTSTGGGLLGVKFLASENWCGRVHFGGHSPEWRVLAKFSVQPCTQACLHVFHYKHLYILHLYTDSAEIVLPESVSNTTSNAYF